MKRNGQTPSGNGKIVTLDFIKGDRYNADAEKERNTIGQRITEARERIGLTKTELGTLVGTYGVSTHRDLVRRWEKRKVIEYRNDLIATGLYATTTPEIEYIDMPVSYLPASAGTGAILGEDKCEWISVPKASVPAGADRGIRVSGDSMMPVYNDGQLVWIQFTKELRPGEEGVFMLNDEGFIKSFSLQEPSEEYREAFTDVDGVVRPRPVLKSYNKAYPPIVITPDIRFEIVGRVLH